MNDHEATYAVGSTIGRFRVLALLGWGDVQTVYLCQDEDLDRRVIVATLDRVTGDNEAGAALIRSYLRGQRLHASVRHKNIVGLFETGMEGETQYHVLEFVEGHTLLRMLSEGKRIPPLVALRLTATVAGALHHLHEHGVAHNSVQPGNLLVTPSGEPVILDFTFASPIATEDEPHSSPPAHAGVPRDIEGTGAMLAALLEGQLSAGFDLRESGPIARSHVGTLSTRHPDYVVSIIERCFADSGEERFASADELARALEMAIETMEGEEGAALAAPSAGQTLLLHVEVPEVDLPGEYREYEIQEFVSEGAFGDVYRARDVFGGKVVALKLLKQRWVADESTVSRFRREAVLLSRLSHPHIVRVFNYGRYGPTFFIAMEFLNGPTLEGLFGEEGVMDPGRAVSLVGQVLDGLTSVHRAGVVHRDIKPDNVKLMDDRAVLFDFGISRAEDLESLTETGMFVGTLAYAAPEQVMGGTLTAATDVYAAGVILYRLLTGKLPFDAKTPAAMMVKIAGETPRSITELRDDLPESLVAAIRAMMDRDPAARPDAATARAACLESISG